MKEEAGFTLVELLAAMIAGSILIVSLGWSVSTLARDLRPSAGALQEARIAALAPALTALIEQAQPPGRDGAGFSGTPDRLEAVVPPPMAAERAGPLRLSLSAASDPAGGYALLARFEPLDPAAAFPAALRVERPLLGGLRSIRFDYVRSDKAAAPRLPLLVTLTLVTARGDERRISAAPRIDSDGRCRFDPISMACR